MYSCLPALVLFGAVEGCARLLEFWRPPLTLDYGWGFNENSRVFMPVGMPRDGMITRPEKMVSFVKQRFRMPKPDDVYRIIALGGSNVNYMQRQLTMMAERLTHEPGESRRFEAINCGGCAYGSHRLRLMMPELLTYDPDLIMIYAGHNEFEELIHQALVNLDAIPMQKAAYSLAMLRLLRDALTSLRLTFTDPEQLRQTLPPEVDYGAAGAYEFSEQEIDERMRLFRENLEAIVSACLERGIPVIISTVASNYWAPDLHRRHADVQERIRTLQEAGRYEEAMALARETLAHSVRHQASDVENGIIREVAHRFSLMLIEGEGLIMDAEPKGIPGETLMSDRCHLNDAGRDIVIRAFEEAIRRAARGQGQDDLH